MNDYNNINPYNGFIKGNLFESTYIPYKNYSAMELKPLNEREYLLLLVQVYDFANHEINLYLETNPNDINALNLRKKFYTTYLDSLTKYENKYGSIDLDNSSFKSINWPWEVSF